jgi:hypothetical protein
MSNKPPLRDLASAICGYLHRFERDSKINAPDKPRGTTPYYNAWAYVAGRYVVVCYVSYQGRSNLTRDEAQVYLDWLKAGNVGTHFQQQRQRKVLAQTVPADWKTKASKSEE